ncbi:MAG: GNAT family N-acetyltransferase [Gemmatimonadaceae bacterium]
MPLEIHEASTADVEAIVDILIASKEASLPHLITEHDRNRPFWTERWNKYLTVGSSAQMSRGDGVALVAREGGRSLGFAAYHHTRRHDADVELESIYVLKDVQRRGVGAALLRAVIERLTRGGDASMCVGYDPKNPYKAFYLKYGATELDPHWAIWRDIGHLLPPP